MWEVKLDRYKERERQKGGVRKEWDNDNERERVRNFDR